MLDAIIPTATYATSNRGSGVTGYVAGITKNAYLDATAKTVGYAFLNNIVASYDGAYWKPINDVTKVLSGDFTTQITATDIGGVSGNGLVYTGVDTPFSTSYSLREQFGLDGWGSPTGTYANDNWNTTNICRIRGMLLPNWAETTISSTNASNPMGGTGNVGGSGVPSHPSGDTWQATAFLGTTSGFWEWIGTGETNGALVAWFRYVRCVR